MKTRRQTRNLRPTQIADMVARRISSPVQRLEFLQLVVPAMDRERALSGRSLALIPLTSVLLLISAGSGPGVRAVHQVQDSQGVVNAGPATVRVQSTAEIWQVEKNSASETWSNGLRIDNRFAVGTRPRSYRVFSTTEPDDIQGRRRSQPAGIVFHTTESLQVPFEASQNAELKDISLSLLAYVRRKQAYNFLIDRFGRVYRIVRESDAANHAGYSVWADSDWVYLNLNQSFLAVSFETRTLPGQREATVNPAQIRSAAMLTEMLRQLYRIAPGNCVTHAQVSVNASNLLVGYHFDWASSFPFAELNLPDNYALPLPSVFDAGFGFDSKFGRSAGARVYREAALAEDILRQRAAAMRLSLAAYRRMLQARYRSRLRAVHALAGRAEDDE